MYTRVGREQGIGTPATSNPPTPKTTDGQKKYAMTRRLLCAQHRKVKYMTTEEIVRMIVIQSSTTELVSWETERQGIRESMYAENWMPVYLPDI